MARLTPTKEVVRRLFALSGNCCAFPGCSSHLIDDNGTLLAQVCHIEAAEKGGQRFNENQSDEERRSFENLMVLCHAHHKVTDDVAEYPPEKLRKIKEDHELAFLKNPFEIPIDVEERLYQEIDSLFQIAEQTLSAVLEGNQTGKKSHETLERMEGMLARALQSQQPVVVDDSKIYAQQLEFIKDFRKQKKPQTALNALLKYREEHWEKINGELQYKVLANLGMLYFELGKKEEGAKQLLGLKTVSFESADCLAYLCLGYAILKMKDEFEAVFQKAHSIQPDNSNLWIAYIYIQDENVPADEIENKVPVSILEKSEILYALGEALLDRGEIQRGFELLQKSIDQSEGGIEDNWYVMNLVESKRLMHIASTAKIALKKFSADELDSLRKSRDTLTTVWDYVSQTEYAAAAWSVVLNRGITNKILGENIVAEQDLEEAWRLSRHFFAFKDLLFHYIDTNRLDKAESILPSGRAAIVDDEDEIEFATCEARLYSAQGHPEKAVELLSAKLDSVAKEDRMKLLDLIILFYFQCAAFSKALPYAQKIIAEFGDRPEGYLATGVCYRMQNQVDEALKSFDCAVERAVDDARMPHIWFHLGEEYSRLEKHEQSISCFEKIAGSVGYNEVHRKLLFEYYHAEDYDKAIALCLQAKSVAPNDALASEVLFRAYQDVGKVEEARSVLQGYLSGASKEHLDYFRLLGVKFYTDLGQADEAVKLILQIEKPEQFSLQHRLTLARQLLESDYVEEGLEIAYNARLDHYSRAEAHEMYIWCCVGRKEQPDTVLYPNEIGMDCAVYLINQSGVQREFFLTDDKRYQSAAILRSGDKWTGLLLGKKLGDAISMPNSVGTGSVLTVNIIMNKHVYAFRESGVLLETKFSGETSMQFLKWEGDENFSALHQFIKNQALQSQQSRREVLRLYDADVVTVGMLAHYFRRNFVEMWFELINTTDTFLRCYTHDESPALSKALSIQSIVIIDPLALLTNLVLLPKYNLLDCFAGRCIVAQSTITELKSYKKELELPGPKFSVGVEEGEVRKHEHTQEATDNTIRLVEEVIDWCEKNATIKSPVKRSNRTRRFDIDVVSVIGQTFHDTVVLASEVSGFVLSDDERLKSFALGEYGIEAFSSYQVAAYQANLGQVSVDDYQALSKTLMAANYAFIPISGIDLWTLFEEGQFRLKPPFTRGVRGLRILSVQYGALTLAAFAKLLYLNVAVKSLREQTMLYVLQEAKRNTNFSSIKPLLLLLIEREFILMPQQKQELKGLIVSLPSHL